MVQDAERAVRRSRYLALRRRVGRLVTSNYDIADRCNLRCEGCLFFAGDDYKQYRAADDLAVWRDFFRGERDRGVNFGYFAGAEPSLEIGRLRAAHEHIDNGVVFSNGLVRIPDDISYRIHVSVWGDESQSIDLRGAGNGKALANYAGDPRAVFVFTVTAGTIGSIHDVARIVATHGGRLTFNLFSPTTKYLALEAALDDSDRQYFRHRQDGGRPVLAASDLLRLSDEIGRAVADFPQAIIYSMPFHRWLARPEGLYRIDPATGIATNCGNRLSSRHRHFNVDLSTTAAKCCSPNLDCAQCRAYAQSYATYLVEQASPRADAGSADEWLDVWTVWARLFLGDGTSRRSPGHVMEAHADA